MTATAIQPPVIKDVTDLMHGLLGLDVKPCAADDAVIYSIAEYTDQSGDPVGYLACDLGSGCRLGASLTQIPAGRVAEAIKEGTLPDNFAENLDEIFNISVNLLASTDGGRVVLKRSAHGPSAPETSDLAARLESRTKTVFGFEIARYGNCKLIVGT